MLCRILSAGLLIAAMAAAQEAGKNAPGKSEPVNAPSSKAAAQVRPLPPPTPPAGAEVVREGVWRYKDPGGKTWIYTKTPFGFSRADESELTDSSPSKESVVFRVISENGDSVQFERDTPFGKSRWTKDKSQLNADEAAAYERQQRKSEPAAPAPKQ